MALETSFRRFVRIDDRARTATALDVQASGTMTRLAAHFLGVIAFRLYPRMGRGAKVTRDFFVTSIATIRADKLSAGYARWR